VIAVGKFIVVLICTKTIVVLIALTTKCYSYFLVAWIKVQNYF